MLSAEVGASSTFSIDIRISEAHGQTQRESLVTLSCHACMDERKARRNRCLTAAFVLAWYCGQPGEFVERCQS